MNPDPLASAAKDVITPVRIQLMQGYEPDLFFDGDRFMSYLNKTYESFDVATYSVSKAFTAPLRRIQRLIIGLRQRGTTIHPLEQRFVENNHVKLFICYSKNQIDCYIGSQNLTHGTNMNVMMKARPEHVVPLVTFFNTLWLNAQ